MNIYDYHSNPKSLANHNKRFLVPHIAYDAVSEDRSLIGNKDIEEGLARHSMYAAMYAINITGKPFLKGEDAILQDEISALDYATRIKKAKWPAFEKILLGGSVSHGHAYTMLVYAEKCLRGPFPEGEKVIVQYADIAKLYVQQFPERTDALKLLKS